MQARRVAEGLPALPPVPPSPHQLAVHDAILAFYARTGAPLREIADTFGITLRAANEHLADGDAQRDPRVAQGNRLRAARSAS